MPRTVIPISIHQFRRDPPPESGASRLSARYRYWEIAASPGTSSGAETDGSRSVTALRPHSPSCGAALITTAAVIPLGGV
ncbi:hypothetical protein AVEN_225228-1 [Araneus ventricosus]|uniref:Uncharacterized protein n=1 Tax=Araneus ventricosus TaxID=182803 RepID=A0A4Y2ALE4_ARAVE|nr:hypothetical protein AVEN_225228-1 [Araneus ventricosus]